jgi:hypothetical protein
MLPDAPRRCGGRAGARGRRDRAGGDPKAAGRSVRGVVGSGWDSETAITPHSTAHWRGAPGAAPARPPTSRRWSAPPGRLPPRGRQAHTALLCSRQAGRRGEGARAGSTRAPRSLPSSRLPVVRCRRLRRHRRPRPRPAPGLAARAGAARAPTRPQGAARLAGRRSRPPRPAAGRHLGRGCLPGAGAARVCRAPGWRGAPRARPGRVWQAPLSPGGRRPGTGAGGRAGGGVRGTVGLGGVTGPGAPATRDSSRVRPLENATGRLNPLPRAVSEGRPSPHARRPRGRAPRWLPCSERYGGAGRRRRRRRGGAGGPAARRAAARAPCRGVLRALQRAWLGGRRCARAAAASLGGGGRAGRRRRRQRRRRRRPPPGARARARASAGQQAAGARARARAPRRRAAVPSGAAGEAAAG